jgi:hypothetical protein
MNSKWIIHLYLIANISRGKLRPFPSELARVLQYLFAPLQSYRKQESQWSLAAAKFNLGSA